jgi:uncharacterized RmlC-like cupin family protein
MINIKFSLVKMQVMPMYGSLPNSEQLKVFRYAEEKHRKIVIATNIAETSVTIPGIVYGKIHTSNQFKKIIYFITFFVHFVFCKIKESQQIVRSN